MLEIATLAYDRLSTCENDQHVIAGVYITIGLAWAHRGFFDRTKLYQEKALKLRSSVEHLDLLDLSWTEVNMANLLASMGHPDNALQCQLKALRDQQIADDNIHTIKSHSVLYQNIGRHKWLLGLFQEAYVWSHMALSSFKDSQNWAMLA